MNPKINDANITNPNIKTNNGVIHVIDRVLMPNMELTCSVCGMGFMTMEALNTHTKMGHDAEKMSAPTPAETIKSCGANVWHFISRDAAEWFRT